MTVFISDSGSKPHDPDLLDQLADLSSESFEGFVWRATRLNQDPLAFSYNGGRWAPPSTYQSVPVLYTSLERDGAIKEMVSWLAQLSPRPSKAIMIHKLKVHATDVVTLSPDLLIKLGVDYVRLAEQPYSALGEFPPSRSQEIGAALSFLGIDGVIVPSARYTCKNLILFDNLDNEIEIEDEAGEEIDWIKFVD